MKVTTGQPLIPYSIRVGDVFEIAAGAWKCKYMVTHISPTGYTMRRVMAPKSKADANRFAENLHIAHIGNFHKERNSR
jgi:hypothetical protein